VEVVAYLLASLLIASWPFAYVIATERLLKREHRTFISLHSKSRG
jgi:hypothetical protein